MNTSRVWAEVDLDAVERNLTVLRRRIGPDPHLLFVVKADAYGHGAVALAHHAQRLGVSAFGVGTAAEGIQLREAGLSARILVLGTIVDPEVDACLRYDLELGLHSSDRARSLARSAQHAGAPARVHLNIDTGMGRLGVLPRRAAAVLRVVQKSPHLSLAGVMTHLAATHEGDNRTPEQLRRFERVLATAGEEGLIPPTAWIHAANSMAVSNGHGVRYDAVRVGLAPLGLTSDDAELRPALSWRTQIVFLKDVPSGSHIGYGGTWTAKRRTRVATLPVGYSDGFAFAFGNRASVLVRGRRAPVIGRVSMDYTTVDVTDVPGACVGDQATLIGRDGEETLTVHELAGLAETIPYEVTCRIGHRVGRTYSGGRGPERERESVPPARKADTAFSR